MTLVVLYTIMILHRYENRSTEILHSVIIVFTIDKSESKFYVSIRILSS